MSVGRRTPCKRRTCTLVSEDDRKGKVVNSTPRKHDTLREFNHDNTHIECRSNVKKIALSRILLHTYYYIFLFDKICFFLAISSEETSC